MHNSCACSFVCLFDVHVRSRGGRAGCALAPSGFGDWGIWDVTRARLVCAHPALPSPAHAIPRAHGDMYSRMLSHACIRIRSHARMAICIRVSGLAHIRIRGRRRSAGAFSSRARPTSPSPAPISCRWTPALPRSHAWTQCSWTRPAGAYVWDIGISAWRGVFGYDYASMREFISAGMRAGIWICMCPHT